MLAFIIKNNNSSAHFLTWRFTRGRSKNTFCNWREEEKVTLLRLLRVHLDDYRGISCWLEMKKKKKSIFFLRGWRWRWPSSSGSFPSAADIVPKEVMMTRWFIDNFFFAGKQTIDGLEKTNKQTNYCTRKQWNAYCSNPFEINIRRIIITAFLVLKNIVLIRSQ